MTSSSRHAGGGTLFTEPFLVVSQRARLAEVANGFAVRDQYGRPLGAVVEADRSAFRKALRVLTNSDRFRPHCFDVRDSGGSVVLKVRVHDSRFLVTRADGTPIGEIARAGRTRFTFSAHGRAVGTLAGRGAWDFVLTDAGGTEVARATKTFDDVLGETFSSADHYVVEVLAQLTDPLASLVIAAALTLDTALRHGG
ncbi:phospholipid scramblase-related protein [Amycolatopsis thermophila]|uniref:Scramblase n=1 Tax=Amycolatopsis thermophila TaxID=206084 RepID=A0ABU0ENH1_9PSEU|nr:phospholipid scramblase-related protein [Amycolatopsis thermophila]MDQ0376849.1 hypothetical protein [Amycolatopsis thermophila]